MRKFLSILLAITMISTASWSQTSLYKEFSSSLKSDFKNSKNSVNKSMNVSFFTEDFEGDLSAWSNVDEDGDGNLWDIIPGGYGHESQAAAWSQSFINYVGPQTPDNWLISEAIDLSAAGASTTLEFWRAALNQTWPAETFSVYISTAGNTVADFTGANGHVLVDAETVTGDSWQKRSIALGSYTGGQVYLAFRHHDCTDQFALLIDDIDVFENTVIDGGITAVTAPSNVDGCSLTATEDVTVTIFNYGGAPLTGFDVSYTINGGAAVTETVSASVPPSGEMDYTFTQQADLSALDFYEIVTSLDITDDSNSSNDTSIINPIHGDVVLTVDVSTDGNAGQAWGIINTNTGELVASHGSYQWDLVNDITTVCLISSECYTFEWAVTQTAMNNGSSNDVVVTYDGTEIDSRTATSGYMLYSIGDGCIADDLAISAVTIPSTVGLGDVNITGTVTNTGADALTAFDVIYSVDGGAASAVYTATCNIATGETFDFTHDVPWTSTLGNHTIEVTVSNANGNGSAATSMSEDIIVINEVFPKTVVYEEGTGTWCGWCVRGLVGLSTMAHDITDDSWIGIAVHNGDPMVVTEYDNAIAGFIGGYPSGIMNRYPIDVDPGLASLQAYYNAHMNVAPVAKIEISDQTWNTTTRDFTVEVTTTFGVDMTGADYNAALIVVEDGLTGTAADWAQANYYAGGTNGDMIDWDGTNYADLADPIPAADMVYNHVGRQLIGGWSGVAGSIPADVTYNVGNTYTFNGSIPADHDENHTHYVAIIIDNSNGTIINAAQIDLDITSGIAKANNANFNIYPNPSTGLVKVEGIENAEITVYNMVGKVVYNKVNAATNTTIDLSTLESGNYIVKVIDNDKVSTQKIILTK